jgi:hypothetical protein
MINTSKYIEKLIEKISTIKTCYYEEAPSGVAYPYIVLSSFNVSDLAYGDLVYFDIEIWFTEYTTTDIDALSDNLRNGLDKTTVNLSNYFTSHINFDNQNMIKDQEQDLIVRRLSFTARIFYK